MQETNTLSPWYSRTESVFVPTTVKLSDNFRNLLEERELLNRKRRQEAVVKRLMEEEVPTQKRVVVNQLSPANRAIMHSDSFEEGAADLVASLAAGRLGDARSRAQHGPAPLGAGAPRTREGGSPQGRPTGPRTSRGQATHINQADLHKTKHRFLGESAVSSQRRNPLYSGAPLTTQNVVGKAYHKSDLATMAKRKIRAIYRQMVGAVADAIIANEVVLKLPPRVLHRA